MNKQTYLFISGIFLILTISAANLCFALSGASGPGAAGVRGSPSVVGSSVNSNNGPSLGGGNSVGSGSSSMGIGNATAVGNGYSSTGPGSSTVGGGSGYNASGVESPSAGTDGYGVSGYAGGSGSAQVQPSSIDSPVDPNTNPNSSLSGSSNIDPDSAQ